MQNSHPYKIDKTLASCNLVVESLKRLCFGIDIAVQIIFMLLYSYSIYTNHQLLHTSLINFILVCVNTFLLLISLSYFITHIILSCKHKAKKAKTVIKKTVAYIKMAIRLFTIGLAVYELIGLEFTTVKLITTVVAIVGFLIQCLFEIIKSLTERYINVITEGVKMDVDEFMNSPLIVKTSKLVDTVKNPKTVILESINRRFRKNEPVIEEQPVLTKLQKKITEKAQEMEDKRQTEKDKKLEDKKREKIIRAEVAVSEFKTNVKSLFKRKKNEIEIPSDNPIE